MARNSPARPHDRYNHHDPYADLGLRRVINAAGAYTLLGGSSLSRCRGGDG